MINRQPYLVLHKSEWDRIKRKNMKAHVDLQRDEYFKALDEQSQNWIKHWPDTVQGHMQKLKEQKKTEHAKLLETVKIFALKKKHENIADAIKKARALIFADSCYGRQLLSALLESKTLEERDVQITFQNELKRQSDIQKIKEPISLSLLDSRQMEIKEKTTKSKSKQIDQNVAEFNKAMFDTQKKKRLKEKEVNHFGELENIGLNNRRIKINNEIELRRASKERQTIKEYETLNNSIKNFRAKREEQDERRREIWRKYQERVKCREKIIFDKIHKEKYDSPQTQKIFKTVQNIEENKKKHYDEFVQKGIERWLDRSKKQEQDYINSNISRRINRISLDDENKALAKLQIARQLQDNKKYTCCRQCILTKCCNKQTLKMECTKKDETAPSILCPKNKLKEHLRNRQMRSSWSALDAAHEQFAVHASDTLKECRFKNAARKVVDEYSRINCIDPRSLQISNYY